MPAYLDFLSSAVGLRLARARGKLLAAQDRKLKAELVELRRESGLTQADVAALIGVSQQAVQKIERYDSDPKLSTLRRYSNAIGALVEHSVTVDRGQSLHLAGRAQWKNSAPAVRIVAAGAARSVSHGPTEWKTLKRTDFALVG